MQHFCPPLMRTCVRVNSGSDQTPSGGWSVGHGDRSEGGRYAADGLLPRAHAGLFGRRPAALRLDRSPGLSRRGSELPRVPAEVRLLGGGLARRGAAGRPRAAARATPLDELLVEGRRTQGIHLRKRLVDAGLKEPRCEGCGIAEW